MTVTTANIDIGDLPNDGTGDPLRTAFEKINENFLTLEGLAPQGPIGAFQFNEDGIPNGTANFTYIANDNSINLGANINIINAGITIGNSSNRISNIYIGNSGLYVGNIKLQESANIISFPISVLPTNKASLAIDNIYADGNLVANGYLQTGGLQIQEFSLTTSNNAANQIVFEMPAVDFRNGIFYIHSREPGANNSQSATIAVNKNNNNNTVGYSVYGTIFVGVVLTDYFCDIGYGNVRVKISPFLNTPMIHSISYQYTN